MKKNNLLTAASEIVKEEGVVKLTLEAVAQRAGV
ncbi:TetR/AcrR family transcriptional regulator, partial [Listeria monocytogenes]|nr:TetR/AcrR family transcriptional regulator [Listeria monocytogenes]EAG7163513.1 TetR/AcrR family transcriptional regulator [Listeria monocytogenes]